MFAQQAKLIDLFGFRPYSKTDSTPLSVERAQELIAKPVGKDWSCDSADVLVNNELLCMPYGYVGCFGVLVERQSGRLLWMGSALPPVEHVWGYYKGARDGQTTNDRLCDISIEEINDLDRTVKLLSIVSGQSAVDLRKSLGSLPFVIRQIDVYWHLREFRAAELAKIFSFKVLDWRRSL